MWGCLSGGQAFAVVESCLCRSCVPVQLRIRVEDEELRQAVWMTMGDDVRIDVCGVGEDSV